MGQIFSAEISMARLANTLEIDGYFLGEEPKSGDDSSENEDISDEDEFVDFSDNNIFSPKSTHIESNPLKNKNVQFKEYRTGKVYHIEGLLHFWEPWWAATLQVRRGHGNKKKIVGFPAYRLRTDPGVVKDNVVLLFMTACKVEPQHKDIFTEYLRLHGLENQLDFEHYPELLRQFGESSEENSAIKNSIDQSTQTGPGMFVWRSSGMEDFFTYMPQLLPRHFKKILDTQHDLIPELQMMLRSEPWTFGFAAILANKLKLFGCEAQLQNIYNSGLIDKFPPEVKDAIHIYTVLKLLSRRFGHTFTHEKWLPNCNQFKDYKVRNWPAALKYLEDNKIIVREAGVSKDSTKIYLTKLWSAEDTIAKGIHTLFKKHKQEPWTFDIDFSKSRFSSLLKDRDQTHAAELISKEPVVVLSGKGGCGKTTVVSSVFQYADELLKMTEHKNYQDQMFAEADLDDFTLTQTANELEKSHFEEQSNKDDTIAAADDDDDNDAESFSQVQGTSAMVNGLRRQFGSPVSETDITNNKSLSDDDDKEEKPSILLTAPTGKAANLLGKKSHLPSFTLHQVIFSYWNWRRGGSKFKDQFIPANEEWKFSEVQALVVDECSLVSVSTFSTLFSALLADAKLQKVVLLGDVNQLPSIEPGNFLSNLYHSLNRWGCSAMLTSNHRSESDLIIDNATLISQQRMPKVDGERNFYQINLEELRRGIDSDSSMDDLGLEQDEAIRRMLKCQRPPLGDEKTSQFVAFRRRDCDAINEICCKHYSNHPTKNHKRKAMFQVGDKVCCSKNAIVKDELTRKDIRLCNGEIFFIKHDLTKVENKKETRLLTLEVDAQKEEEKKQIQVNFRALKYSCKLKHAWARTIHTYQGSESDTVVYVVGSPGGQTWQHVYTAVTRGRKQVILITRKSHLDKAISNLPGKRFTSLQDKVCEELKGFEPPKIVPEHSHQNFNHTTPTKQKQRGNYLSGNSSGSSFALSPRTITVRGQASGFQTFANRHLNKSDNSKLTNGHRDIHHYGSEIKDPGSPGPSSCAVNINSLLDNSRRPDSCANSIPGNKGHDPCQADLRADDQEDSQGFSDWGDDILDDITQLESDLSTSVSHGSRQREDPSPAPISVSASAAEKRRNILKDAGNLLVHNGHGNGDISHQTVPDEDETEMDSLLHELLENSAGSRRRLPTRSKVEEQTVTPGAANKAEHKRRLDFGIESTNESEMDDILSDLVAVTPRSKGHPKHGSTGIRIKTSCIPTHVHPNNTDSNHFMSNQPLQTNHDIDMIHNQSTNIQKPIREDSKVMDITASPKRMSDAEPPIPNKKRLNHEPITNSDVSPLRRELLNIGLSSK